MTHYGSNYRYLPFENDIKKNMYEMDKKTIDFITNNDCDGFKKRLKDINGTVCGKWPILTLMNAVDSTEIKLLKYYTSADVYGDYTNAVGYAAIVFK